MPFSLDSNDTIVETRRHRQQLARGSGYNVKKLMDHYLRRERARKDTTHKPVFYVQAVSPESGVCALR